MKFTYYTRICEQRSDRSSSSSSYRSLRCRIYQRVAFILHKIAAYRENYYYRTVHTSKPLLEMPCTLYDCYCYGLRTFVILRVFLESSRHPSDGKIRLAIMSAVFETSTFYFEYVTVEHIFWFFFFLHKCTFDGFRYKIPTINYRFIMCIHKFTFFTYILCFS